MNTNTDFDRYATAWLADGPTELADRVLDAALREVHFTHQRHVLRVPWRLPYMPALTRASAVAAVVLVAAVGAGGALLLSSPGPGGNSGGPFATASPSPRPSPSPVITAVPSPNPTQLADSGPLFPGAYIPQFDPGLTFTIDHEVEHNCAPGYQCRGSIDANVPGWVDLEFGQPRIEFAMVRVDKVDDPAHPGQLIDPPADLAAWIASRPGVSAIAQKPVSVGGIAGTQLDLRTGTTDVLLGPIPDVTDPPGALAANSMYRLFVVAVHGHQVLIALVAESGSIEELQPLVDSIAWN